MLKRDRGFTIVEVLLALAILAILAAIILPTTAGQLRQGQSAALASQIVNLRDAIGNYRENVGAYPIALRQLTSQPLNGETDSCGANLSAAERGAWRGPYLTQDIVGDMPVGDAIIVSTLQRVIVGSGVLLAMRAARVDPDIATDIEARFDGNANFTTGSVLWTAAGDDTLTFRIPIRGC